MSDHESQVTLVWAADPMRHWGFLRQGIAGIDFGVTTDLTGMSEDEVVEVVKQFDQSSQVAGQFRRLLFGTPIGSLVVTGAAARVTRSDRKWSIGRVAGGYEFRDRNPHDRHTIKIEWSDQTYSQEDLTRLIGTNPSGRRSTVTPLGTVEIPETAAGTG